MKAYAFLILSVLIAQSSFGQRHINDFDFKKPPTIKLVNLDSVKLIRIFKAEQTGLSMKTLDGKGYLDMEITLNEDQKMTSWRRYIHMASKVIEEYQFTYSGEKDIFIEQVVGQTSKRHSWHLRDTLIQEIKLVKGKKQIAQWTYTYLNDTLISRIVKLDNNHNIEYEIQYEYSNFYKLIGQTVTERGYPTAMLEADYDPEGNLIGYRSKDLRKNTEQQRVELMRDSSAQVSAVDYLNKKGNLEHCQNEYNEKGFIQSSTRLNTEGEGLERTDYSYDDSDNLIKKSKTHNDILKEQIVFVYDDKGNLTSRHYYKRAMGVMDLKHYAIATYDEDNRLIRKDQWSKVYSTRVRLDYEYISF